MIIDVVAKRDSPGKADVPECENMSPGSFFLHQLGKENQSTEVVKGGNEIPLFSRIRSKQVIRRVMLEKLACIMGRNLPVMGLKFPLGDIKSVAMMAERDTFS